MNDIENVALGMIQGIGSLHEQRVCDMFWLLTCVPFVCCKLTIAVRVRFILVVSKSQKSNQKQIIIFRVHIFDSRLIPPASRAPQKKQSSRDQCLRQLHGNFRNCKKHTENDWELCTACATTCVASTQSYALSLKPRTSRVQNPPFSFHFDCETFNTQRGSWTMI